MFAKKKHTENTVLVLGTGGHWYLQRSLIKTRAKNDTKKKIHRSKILPEISKHNEFYKDTVSSKS